MIIHAAVIEWPDHHIREPELILSLSRGSRAVAVRAAIIETAEALESAEWLEALKDHRHFPEELHTWTEMVFGDMDDRPTITTYQKEV